MTVVFFAKQDIQTIISSIQTSEFWTVEEYPVKIESVQYTHRMVDRDFPDSWANLAMNDNVIQIRTAWSEFNYTITGNDQGCMVVYEGAYMGLLAQNILPEMTPVDLLENSTVESSLLNATEDYCLADYIPVREKLVQLQKETGAKGNYGYTHPKCVTKAIMIDEIDTSHVEGRNGRIYINGGFAFVRDLTQKDNATFYFSTLKGELETMNWEELKTLHQMTKTDNVNIVNCRKCGDEICCYSDKYRDEWPNSCDEYVEQKKEEHEECLCSVAEVTDEEEDDIAMLNPKDLIAQQIQQFQELGRLAKIQGGRLEKLYLPVLALIEVIDQDAGEELRKRFLSDYVIRRFGGRRK